MESDADAKLKQFDVLWAEIGRRSNTQQALVGATATATGTVGGLVVGGKASTVLLVVLAVVAPVFGLLWVDHAQNIGRISDFIRKNWDWQPNWERECREELSKAAGTFRYGVFVLATTLVFLAPAVGGLTASVGQLGEHTGRIVAWGSAVAVTALFTLTWLVQIVRSRPRKGTGQAPNASAA